MSPSRSLVSTM